jgi:hypothetical protein
VTTADSQCPKFKGPGAKVVSHGQLSKDERPDPLLEPERAAFYDDAVALATDQTTHEWCRLQYLVYKEHGVEGIKFLCENWVGDAVAANAACSGLPAEAQCGCTSLSVTPSSGPAGTEVFVTGSGYVADEAVDITFDGSWVGGTCCNPGDPYFDHFFVPASAPGTYRVETVGQTSGTNLCGLFTVP